MWLLKRSWWAGVLAGLWISGMVWTPPADALTATVSKGYLLRSEPRFGQRGYKTGKVWISQQVTVSELDSASGYVRVRFRNGRTEWIHRQALRSPSAPLSSLSNSNQYSSRVPSNASGATITARAISGYNLREAPRAGRAGRLSTEGPNRIYISQNVDVIGYDRASGYVNIQLRSDNSRRDYWIHRSGLRGFSGSLDSLTAATVCENCTRRSNANGLRGQASGILEVAAASRYAPLPRTDRRPSQGSMSYAERLTQCARRVARRGLDGKCAKAVRLAAACAGLGNIHSGASAVDYVDGLARKGFVHDARACNSPGVIRVYEPQYSHLRRRCGASCRRNIRRQSGYYPNAGDFHGHIEILGTDGRYYSSSGTSRPINATYGNSRRQLTRCYVKRSI